MPEASEIKLIIKNDPNLIVFDYLFRQKKGILRIFYKIFHNFSFELGNPIF